MLASARDLCLFGELLLRRGRWGGRALLDERFVAALATVDPVTAAASADPARDDARRRGYGFLVYVNAGGLWQGIDHRAFALLGAYGNACLVDPGHDLVFVRLVTPEDRRRADGSCDDALFANVLDVTDHGTARMWRAVLAAFAPRGRLDALRGRIERARLDTLGDLRTRARRRGLGS